MDSGYLELVSNNTRPTYRYLCAVMAEWIRWWTSYSTLALPWWRFDPHSFQTFCKCSINYNYHKWSKNCNSRLWPNGYDVRFVIQMHGFESHERHSMFRCSVEFLKHLWNQNTYKPHIAFPNWIYIGQWERRRRCLSKTWLNLCKKAEQCITLEPP